MGQLHILFLPMMAHGHMIPTLDMAKLFTSKGLKTTIISTPAFADPIEKAQNSGFNIGLKIIKFPPKQSELPDHIVSLDQATSDDLLPKFIKSLSLLQEPVDKLIQELHPNCLISDMFLPWTVNSAAKFGIPRLVFHGISYLSLCSIEQMRRYKPFNNVSSDSEQFVLPDLPHELKFVRTQVAKYLLEENNVTDFMERVRDADLRSYGVVVNSFYEMEHDYADYYKNVLGRKAWNIGPLLLCNNRGYKGNKMWQRVANEGVDREAVAKAVEIVMVGELASEMRNRVKCYKEMARKAVEEGGSSYNNLSALIEDLSAYSPSRNNVVQDI
ncbi:hypothetical protein DH2020_023902 [Rehmannia glutinosa]|uniref:Uncharacterized protein n=1 Tax=Rehmannia glutinosa TaxID=99300 RepID=A0ABR0WBU4_REHGL